MNQRVKDRSIVASRHIILGISGSIAAFKAAELASELVKKGFTVRVVMTPGALRFITPLSFEALTGSPVGVEVWDEQLGGSRMGHLDLARWAELILVAPASAGCLARLALGTADDMLGAIVLASDAPVFVAPSMETNMWRHSATQAHVETLQQRGVRVLGPEDGRLASGSTGEGRMMEPLDILAAVTLYLEPAGPLHGVRVLITAGPTFEPIDPVRFIGNRSSGKMGLAIAREARQRGADVMLILGPMALPPPDGVETIRVESAADMRRATLAHASASRVIVMSAAVADYRVAEPSATKLERGAITLNLVPTEDIAAELQHAAPDAVRIGFALESHDLLANARAKLLRKGLHLLVANAVGPDFSPFGQNVNRVSFLTPDTTLEHGERTKSEIARLLWDAAEKLLSSRA